MKHFKSSEFLCNDNCGMDINELLKSKLDLAREYSGVPYNITSGARCVKHNKAVGGVENSAHTKGLAVDISFKDVLHSYKIVYGLSKVGFDRIGINLKKKFIHADIDLNKSKSIWEYK